MDRAQQDLEGALHLILNGFIQTTQDTTSNRQQAVQFIQKAVQRWETEPAGGQGKTGRG